MCNLFLFFASDKMANQAMKELPKGQEGMKKTIKARGPKSAQRRPKGV